MKDELNEKILQNMRGFLFVFRHLALFLGLLLSKFGTESLISIPAPLNNPIVFILALLFCEIIAGVFAYNFCRQETNIYALLAADVIFGVFLCYFFGMPFFFLAVVFPVFEAYFYLPARGFLITLASVVFIYTPLLWYLISSLKNARVIEATPVTWVWKFIDQLEIFILTGFALIFLYSLSFKNTSFIEEIKIASKKEKKDLVEEINHLKSEMKDLFNELEYRKENIAALENDLVKSQEELEKKEKEIEYVRQQGKHLLEASQKKQDSSFKNFTEENAKLKEKISLLSDKSKKYGKVFEDFQKINFSPDLGQTLINIAEAVQKILPSQTYVFFIPDKLKDQDKIFPEVMATPYEDYFRNVSFLFKEGVVGLAANLKMPIKIDEGQINIEGQRAGSLIAYEKSVLVVPVVFEDKLYGLFYIGRAKKGAFSQYEFESLILLSQLIGTALNFVYSLSRVAASRINDSLTGLYNEIYFQERLQEEEKRAQRYKLSLGVLILDIDGFSKLNDAFGMPVGDEVLKEVAGIVKDKSRETDVVARIGNDEFGVILVQTEKNASILIAERIRMAIGLKCFAKRLGSRVNLSASIGIAEFPDDTQDVKKLMRLARISLNSAKSRGGDKTFFKS